MADISILNTTLIADPSGALYWPEKQVLIVADMHLEKGSAFATRGQLLPPYDSALTLSHLMLALDKHKPQRLVALGDSFHDVHAGARMDPISHERLTTIASSLQTTWITGNHDPEIPTQLPGERMSELKVGPLTFRHEPQPSPQPGEVAGHLHPAAKVVTERGRVRRRCFVSDGSRLLMPAFGAYAGGLNLRDSAISQLFNRAKMAVHVCGKAKVYPVSTQRLFPD